MTNASLFIRIRAMLRRHPLVRGMISYAVLWPTGSAIQQITSGKTPATFDWKQCVRFSFYGSLYVAPILYSWMRLSSVMWPGTNFKTALTKATVDQLAHGPFAMSSFYIGMNLLESKSLSEAFEELTRKFWPTFRVSVRFWPVMHTINFYLVPEKNRVVFVSIMSVIWTTFLARMKNLEKEQ